MRPVRGQRKSAAGSSHNIAMKKQGKKPEVLHQPIEGIVQEEEEDDTQVKLLIIQKIPEYARLTPQELNMTYTRSLVVVNPQAPANKITYDFN